MEMNSITPEAQSEEIAKKLLKGMKKVTWSIPDRILLQTNEEMSVGRCHPASIMMHSPRLPSMISRKHATVTYISDSQQWAVKDLQSVNGVYINNVKIPSLTPMPIKLGDEVCFGVNLTNNEFKYVLTENRGRYFLKRSGYSSDVSGPENEHDDGDQTPPTGSPLHSPLTTRIDSQSSQSQRQGLKRHGSPGEVTDPGNEQGDGDRTPPTSSPLHSSGLAKRAKLDSQTSETQLQIQDQKEFPTPLYPTIASFPVKKTVLVSPSPLLSTTTSSPAVSQLNVEDVLFPDGPPVGHVDWVSEALFGEEEPQPSEALKKLKGADSATIQIELAKEEMAKEKHQLLSSIEALRSELAAKEELLTNKKEEEEREAASKANESMLSSMQEEFTCVICQELFVHAYTLPCSHSYCEWCIKEWMKTQRQRDCPICRKRITSDPVHSRALDNAISKMVEKMGPEAQGEREAMLKQHTENLKKFEPPKVMAVSTRAGSTSTRSRSASSGSSMTTRSATSSSSSSTASSSRSGITTGSRAPAAASHSVPGTSTRPIVIDDAGVFNFNFGGSSITIDGRGISIDGGGITFGHGYHDEDEDEDEDDYEDGYDDSDSYEEGLLGAYYGGYGTCHNCGKHGHWINGCPHM